MAHCDNVLPAATTSRRTFLKSTVASAAVLSSPAFWRTACAAAAGDDAAGRKITVVSEHVLVYHARSMQGSCATATARW